MGAIGPVTIRELLDRLDVAGASLVEMSEILERALEEPASPPWEDVSGQLLTHPEKAYPVRELAEIDTVVVHHSGPPTDQRCTLDAIAAWHVWGTSDHKVEWPGIAYDVVVYADGRAYLVKPPDLVGYHCGEWNTRSVGIVLVGDYSDSAPPDAQLEAARQVISWWRAQGLVTQIKAHREIRPTACPGELWREWVPRLWSA